MMRSIASPLLYEFNSKYIRNTIQRYGQFCNKNTYNRLSILTDIDYFEVFSKYFDENNWPNMTTFFCPKRWAILWNPWKKQFFQILRFLVYEICIILYSKFLENWPKRHHKLPNYWVLFRFCSRLVDQNEQNLCRIFFIAETYAKTNSSKAEQKPYIRGDPLP